MIVCNLTTLVKLLVVDAPLGLKDLFHTFMFGISSNINAVCPSKLIDILSGCWLRLLTTIQNVYPTLETHLELDTIVDSCFGLSSNHKSQHIVNMGVGVGRHLEKYPYYAISNLSREEMDE